MYLDELTDLDISFQSLRGPRGGMIFFRKDPILGVDLESAINNAVFPGLQVSTFWLHGNKSELSVYIYLFVYLLFIVFLASYTEVKYGKMIEDLSNLCRVVLIITLSGDLRFA